MAGGRWVWQEGGECGRREVGVAVCDKEVGVTGGGGCGSV